MASDSEIPSDGFWHCMVQRIGVKGKSGYAVLNDANFEKVDREIIKPWLAGRRFVVDGMVIATAQDVETIKISRTTQPMRYYADIHNASMRASGIADLATDRKLLPISQGEDFTARLLFPPETEAAAIPPDVALLLRICERLPLAARALAIRQRGKPAFVIEDEYDVQDLFRAVVRAYFKNSIAEEPIGKVAGGKSSRADFALEDIGVIVEAKFVRGPSEQPKLVSEIAEDLVQYSKWGPLTDLIVVVYNSQDLADPEGLDKLRGGAEVAGKRFRLHIVRA